MNITDEMVEAALAAINIVGRAIDPTDHAMMRAALTAALAQPASTGWRPIKSAPKDGTEVIICVLPHKLVRVAYFNKLRGYWMSGGFRHDPDKWQPLPPAPESEPSK